MKVELANGATIDAEDQPFAEGGEGVLFWDKAGTHVVKLYKQADQAKLQRLQMIIDAQYNVVQDDPYWDEMFTWPKDIVVSPALGLTMLRAPGDAEILRWFLSPKARAVLARRSSPDRLGKWINYLSVAIKMARVVKRMHMRGLCHSDLSFNNYLIDPLNNRVVLIDCDSMVVPGFLPPQVLGTPMCMAPELYAQLNGGPPTTPSARTDLHAMATLIYWILFQRHPLDGPKFHHQDVGLQEVLMFGERALFVENQQDTSNFRGDIPQHLSYQHLVTSAVAELIDGAFITGLHDPDSRPQAAHWERGLVRMADSILHCSNANCDMGWFVGHPSTPIRCPECGTRYNNPPVMPVLTFYRPRPGRQGEFFPDDARNGYIMLGTQDKALHKWHVDPSISPGPGVETDVKGVLHYEGGAWYLVNYSMPDAMSLSASGWEPIPINGRIELVNDARILLGPKETSRLVYVQLMHL